MNIWDKVYEMYKDYYTKEQIDEMTFAELGELIDAIEYGLQVGNAIEIN